MAPVTGSRAWGLLLALASSGCSLRSACQPPPTGGVGSAPPVAASSAGRSVASAGAPDAASPEPPGPAASWVTAVRASEWEAAAMAIDALEPAERELPEVRYARARAAWELGDAGRAAERLADLEERLPLLASEIREQRAAAWLAAGSYDAAIEYYSRREDAPSQLALARAQEAAGRVPLARAAADRALQTLLAARRDEAAQAEARLVRARLAAAAGDAPKAAAIYRWLATHVPTSPHAVGADARVSELAPARKLTRAERLARAQAFARSGAVAATEHELARLADAPGPVVAQAEVLATRALARYSARSELDVAAELFTRAAALDAARRPHHLYLAARAISRRGDDRRAVVLFQALTRRFPRAPEAADARFQVARLYNVLGDTTHAIAAYGTYLDRHGSRGEFADSARYERAIARLIGGDHGGAERELRALVPGRRDELLQASYRELRAVALLGAGRRADAERELVAVIQDEPLSLPALLAAARLRSLGVTPPAPIAPPESAPPVPPLVVALPPKVALLHRIGLDADAEVALQAAVPQLRRTYGDRGDEATCLAFAELTVADRRLAAGRRAAGWRSLERAPSPRTRWLWDCLYPRPYAPLVDQATRTEGLPEHLVYAVMRQESAFDPDIVSPARAVGLLQLIPPTAEAVARELELAHEPRRLEVPAYNIALGARYLHRVLERFGAHPALAAAAYNAGPQAVSRWLETGESLPLDLFVARIPFAETRLYVHRVLGNLARYAYLAGGEAAVPALDLALPQGKRALPEDY